MQDVNSVQELDVFNVLWFNIMTAVDVFLGDLISHLCL